MFSVTLSRVSECHQLLPCLWRVRKEARSELEALHWYLGRNLHFPVLAFSIASLPGCLSLVSGFSGQILHIQILSPIRLEGKVVINH